LTVVDDVVTEGETLLAAASHVAEVFPRAQIRGFAIARTRGSMTDIEDPKDPHHGLIALTGENSVRRDD
jgi:hypoxanthine phosphoribosyltransferase